uniref:AB hydrolase-1 domain-containing protein n=1 Tax=Kalanchoe fedtschenkoi TaxID=63787 RepID=A0A7N0TCX3_KALFE
MPIFRCHTFVVASALFCSPVQLLHRRTSSPLLPSSLYKFLIAFSTSGKVSDKPSICTADELHYVALPASHWNLALWRYIPCPQAPSRNHPLLLLSGVGTNAIGYDLSPESSFARYMSRRGFDTWILEVRGTGLSLPEQDFEKIEQSARKLSQEMENVSKPNKGGFNDSHVSDIERKPHVARVKSDESRLVRSDWFSDFVRDIQSKTGVTRLYDLIPSLNGDSQPFELLHKVQRKLLCLIEPKRDSAVARKITSLTERLIKFMDHAQQSFSSKLFYLHQRAFFTVDEFQKQLELMAKYNWDFDHYLDEDVPVAMEYVRSQTMPRDGRVLAIGHSMGGILLYATLSRYAYEGKDSGLAAVVTLASSLDYTNSQSTLKFLLPFADPAQTLNLPVIPLGALLAATYPLSSRTPYVTSWLYNFISAENMMHPELLKKLILNSFCSIPAKLLLQLATAFRGGLSNRDGTFSYKDHLHKINVPVLALAGDTDRICPPEAVLETVKLFPKDSITYKVFGEAEGPHYAHYDLVGGRQAPDQVYPCIAGFLISYD